MNTNNNKYPKGSEWRKWDLHIHTPLTKLNDQYTVENDAEKWNLFCQKIKESDVAVFGITDYFSVENYFIFFNLFKNKHPDSEKVFFPNVEFRIDSKNGNNENIQFHIIFSNKENIANKLENFFTRLELISTDDESLTNKYCTDNDLKEVGYDKAMVKLSELNKKLKADFTKDEYLVVGVANGYGSLRPNSPTDGRGSEYAKELDKKCDMFFGNSKNVNFFLNKMEGRDKFKLPPKPVLFGCDAHSFDVLDEKLGKSFEKQDETGSYSEITWIKADPTFEGLKQIIYEPEHRVYIGEEPPIFNKVRNNKTKYIDFLKVNQISEKHTAYTWFKDIKIPFNKELVAIIGNKGSGKSSIADILGLVGDSDVEEKDFSFLQKNKFLKGGLAKKFKAQIIWESGGESEEMCLDRREQIETGNSENCKPESVRYIPQNYFEKLTNDLEIAKFQAILEKIIFGYIPEDKKLEKVDFNSLEKYKTENVKESIKNIKKEISQINHEIIELENKKCPDYIQKIYGLITQKEVEIKDQEKLLTELPKVSNPNKIQGEGDNNKESNNIAKWNTELDELKETYHTKNNEKIAITKDLESLKQMHVRVVQQKQVLDEFLKNNENEAVEYGLDIRKILKVDADYSSINILIQDAEMQLNDISPYFKSVVEIEADNTQKNNISLWWSNKILQNKINTETKKMSSEQQAFQKYEKNKKETKEKIKKLTGDTENPENETLNFYKKERQFVKEKLGEQLNNKREKRLEFSLKIFNKKNEILDLYNDFKKAVDNTISENKGMLDDCDIKIESTFKLESSFFDNFLDNIQQNKKGSFYSKDEGEQMLKKIIEDKDVNKQNDIQKILNDVISYLESDKRNGSNDEIRHINEQVKDLDKFYTFLFSLDYVEPIYELKLEDKTLDKLSPGERGALLLIFYLMIDKEDIPLIIDQPEDNLDNESVYNMLSKFIKKAKQKRQIIMVTHNPNLAVGADAEQIIHVSIDKQNRNKFSFISGSIENPDINKKIVRILEGTKPAFDKRKLKYQEN